MKKLIILTGAGMSAESGIKTFRDMGGVWEEHDVMEVATPQAWDKDPQLVLRFYNQRRKQLFESNPHKGHYMLAELENFFDVEIITQNVDDLHERGGSTTVIHLHGELKKARSTVDPNLIYYLNSWELKMGDTCEKGSQLRPHVVWFGESVPAMEDAIERVKKADIFVVIGTSLNVYPAANLLQYTGPQVPIYIINPDKMDISANNKITFFQNKAGEGIQLLKEHLLKQK